MYNFTEKEIRIGRNQNSVYPQTTEVTSNQWKWKDNIFFIVFKRDYL